MLNRQLLLFCVRLGPRDVTHDIFRFVLKHPCSGSTVTRTTKKKFVGDESLIRKQLIFPFRPPASRAKRQKILSIKQHTHKTGQNVALTAGDVRGVRGEGRPD